MAVAEARTVWQRTVNRCSVQEDAKRGPKLACCQSSSSPSNLTDTTDLRSAADGPCHPTVAVMPLNTIPSYTNISPETRWWLKLQPIYGFQSCLISDQSSTADTVSETLLSGVFNLTREVSEAQLEKAIDGTSEVIGDTTNSNFQVSSEGIANDVMKDSDAGKAGLKALPGETSRELHVCEGVKGHHRIAEMDPDWSTACKHFDEIFFPSEASCAVCQKTKAWWRVTNRNELASFVAKKSLGCIENCDLPLPRNHVKTYPFTSVGCTEFDDKWPSPSDEKSHTYGSSCPSMYIPATSTQERERLFTSSEVNNSAYNSCKLSSGVTFKDKIYGQKVFESDLSKAQLLQALCHAQTRAREAEKAAKQACAKMEHVVKLFLREASQLYANKQWMHLLQLEATYRPKKNNDGKITDDHLTVLPKMPHGSKKLESGQKAAKERQGSRPSHDISDFAVTLALGLSLVGTGVILGWTAGWMLRSFETASEIGVTPVSCEDYF